MRSLLPIIAVLMVSCGEHAKPVDAMSLTEKEVRDFVAAYDKAWEQRDTTTMKEMMDTQYIYYTSTGATTDKNKIIGWFTPADKYKIDTAYRNEISVLLNGNTAIVNTHWVGSGVFGTEKFDDDQRCGLVIQKKEGKLKIIAEHCTQIVK